MRRDDGGEGQVAPAAFRSRISGKRHIAIMALFVLALLSKPMAVTFPFVLLILDWQPLNRISSLKTLGLAVVEKVPFLALSAASALVTILAQRAAGAMNYGAAIPLPSRLLVAARSLVAYLWKTAVPLELIPFYAYPSRQTVSQFAVEYLLAALLVIGTTVVCLFVARRMKLWLSIWGYFLVSLVPVLGIFQVGGQSMADRYVYLADLGPFLGVGLAAAAIANKTFTAGRWARGVQLFGVAAISVALVAWPI